jgi:hypothetical protein
MAEILAHESVIVIVIAIVGAGAGASASASASAFERERERENEDEDVVEEEDEASFDSVPFLHCFSGTRGSLTRNITVVQFVRLKREGFSPVRFLVLAFAILWPRILSNIAANHQIDELDYHLLDSATDETRGRGEREV